ncbi:helix-turn-helix transcriptional regulator [Pectobacterium sp. B1J-3]|uniref:helix-turn-helix transcriptional regulator n=1 Tax=Pectobacterium sp. B1J-3 TaxID=3385371 RepID=UPI0039059372
MLRTIGFFADVGVRKIVFYLVRIKDGEGVASVNKILSLEKNECTDKLILVFDNNVYVQEAITEFLSEKNDSAYIISVVDDINDLFYQIAINENVDAVFVAYNPVWMQTLHAIYKLKHFYPDVKIIVLLDSPHFPSVVLMRSFEVSIILSKKDNLDCLNSALALEPSSCYLSPSLAVQINDKRIDDMTALEQMDIFLTPMECFILAELFGEKSTLSIAKERGCSVKTIHQHKKNALVKMGFNRLVELIGLCKGDGFLHRGNESALNLH